MSTSRPRYHDSVRAGRRATRVKEALSPAPHGGLTAVEASAELDADLPISWSDQAGLVELQVIHVGRNRVTDHPSVRIRPQQLVRPVHAG
jgi:hypothetical protein